MNATNSAAFTLKQHGLTVTDVHRNLPPSALYEHAIRYEKDASIAENGALVAYSGVKTGRSPKDRLWHARFRCLQRGRVSGKSPDDRHGLDHEYRSQPRG